MRDKAGYKRDSSIKSGKDRALKPGKKEGWKGGEVALIIAKPFVMGGIDVHSES